MKIVPVILFLIFVFLLSAQDDPDWMKKWKKLLQEDNYTPPKLSNLTFSCAHIPPQSNPTNVNKLRPSDIKVVMALGDSMTAGFAMVDIAFIGSFFEYRGRVASIGADENAVTIPNFIQKVSQRKVIGGSIKYSFPWEVIKWKERVIRPHNPPIDHLNAAESGAKAVALSSQIDYLVKQMVAEGVNVQNDWKLLTILMGANDVCASCSSSRSSPDNYEKEVNDALKKIKENIPRVFVNIVTMFNISQVWNYTRYPYCAFVLGFLKPCKCLSDPQNRKNMDLISLEYNKRLYKIEKYWNSQNYTEFAVKVQPVLTDIKIHERSIVSKLDCFHPSEMVNRFFAIGLWNSMISPSSEKPRSVDENTKLKCPTENTYLQ